MHLNSEIALNFFPTEQQAFSFSVYRQQYDEQGAKAKFSDCSKRELPYANNGNGQDYSPYWVSFNPKEGFDEFICKSTFNVYLTVDYLYHLLKTKCTENLSTNEYKLSTGFRSRMIFFYLKTHYEGKEVVWLEPYYLKASKTFGFLADYKFEVSSNTADSRRIQYLSLSTTKEGGSNKNFYVDHYEKLKEFILKFSKKLFPLEANHCSVNISRNLLGLETKSLQVKRYVFSNEKMDKSQFTGLKVYGPLQSRASDVKVYFLYKEGDKILAEDLYKALRGDTYPTTFPGMEKMFSFKLSRENVGGRSIDGYDTSSLSKVLDAIEYDANGKKVVPVLLFPHKKGDSPEASQQYYKTKYVFLQRQIPSQFVSIKQLCSQENLKWSIANIALQLFAKMGGKPWKVLPKTNNCLIVGIGQAHKKTRDTISKYYAYSVLTESTGLYRDLVVLGKNSEELPFITQFKENLKKVIHQYYDDYECFVIHATFSIRRKELDAVQEVLDQLREEKGEIKRFVVMKFNDHNKFFGYSLCSNSLIPFESSYVSLSNNEFLVWFEGLQFHNPNILKKVGRPIYIQFLYPKTGLSKEEMEIYLQDALNISGANWRGFNAKSLPVSIFYAYLVAEYYKEFHSLGLEDLDLESMNPWFL